MWSERVQEHLCAGKDVRGQGEKNLVSNENIKGLIVRQWPEHMMGLTNSPWHEAAALYIDISNCSFSTHCICRSTKALTSESKAHIYYLEISLWLSFQYVNMLSQIIWRIFLINTQNCWYVYEQNFDVKQQFLFYSRE